MKRSKIIFRKQCNHNIFVKGFLYLVCGLVFSFGCKSKPQQPPDIYTSIKFEKPNSFPDTYYTISDNPPTPAGFKLGKALFYDGILSRDGSISCGTCHQHSYAFTHHEHNVSHGIDDKLGQRNAPSLQNLAWSSDFGWAGGINHLDLFPIEPIQSPVEMDERLSNVVEKLRNHPIYPRLFKDCLSL
jgi:cytochrome c peroxidase